MTRRRRDSQCDVLGAFARNRRELGSLIRLLEQYGRNRFTKPQVRALRVGALLAECRQNYPVRENKARNHPVRRAFEPKPPSSVRIWARTAQFVILWEPAIPLRPMAPTSSGAYVRSRLDGANAMLSQPLLT